MIGPRAGVKVGVRVGLAVGVSADEISVGGAPTLVSIDVTPDAPTLPFESGAVQFTATGTYSDASTDDLTAVATWGSTDTGVATVNGSGLVTPVDSGTTSISATVGAVSGNETATVTKRQEIAVTNLVTASSSVDGTVFNTASIAPAANALILAFIVQYGSAAPLLGSPTLAGNGLTWVEITAQNIDANRRIQVFRAMGASPSAGAVTITHPATRLSCIWSIVQCTNVDTSGTNGSGAVVQSDTGSTASGTTVNATLAALESATNVHVAGVALSINSTVTPDADFAELGDDGEVSNAITLETEWALNQLACDPTFSTAAAGIIGVEVKSLTL